MYLQLIRFLFLACITGLGGSRGNFLKTCATEGKTNCTQYKICTEDGSHHIYPGRIKTLVQDFYIPRGLTQKASVILATTTDKSVILLNATLTFKDDALTLTTGTYRPVVPSTPGQRVVLSTDGTYHFGDMNCIGIHELVNDASVSSTSPLEASTSESIVSFHGGSIIKSAGSPLEASSPESTVSSRDASTSESTVSSLDASTSESTVSSRNASTSESTVSSLDASTSESTVGSRDASTSQSTVSALDSSTSLSTSSPKDFCGYCLVQLAVDYLMADITNVPDNSTRTVTTTFVTVNVTLRTATTLVLRPFQNTSVNSTFSTNISEVVDFPFGSIKAFELQAVFPNPLSAYKLKLESPDIHLRIATVVIRFVGDHYKGIVAPTLKAHPDDVKFCKEGPDTRVIDFGYLPNKGIVIDFGYLPNKGTSEGNETADTITLEVILFMSQQEVPGKIHPLKIFLEENEVMTKNITIYFNTIDITLQIGKLTVNDTQESPLLPKSGSGSVLLTFNLPPYSHGKYEVKTSARRFAGPGGAGLNVAAVLLTAIGSNFPCVLTSTHWKNKADASISVSNIPYILGSPTTADSFGFEIKVIALPELVEAYSVHELTVALIYSGDGSPQTFKHYFNITNKELFTIPDENGIIPMEVDLSQKCRSRSLSTDVVLILRTQLNRQYGRLVLELPISIGSMRQSFTICNPEISTGYNIVGRFFINITKLDDEIIEKVFVDMSPLTNIPFPDIDGVHNRITLNMAVTFTDKNMYVNNRTMLFKASIISNNRPIWTGELPIAKPEIEYYPDFIVMTGIEKIAGVNSQNIWYHYSINGSYFHQQALVFESGSDEYVFEFPKVIAYFHISADSCVVICNVETSWLPLKDYITIVNDKNNRILRMVPYALDNDSDTCFDLPIPGEVPSMLWLMIKKLSLFGVTSTKFVVHITGEDIVCARVGQKSLAVGTSGPSFNNQCSIESEIVFCKLLSENTNGTLTQCDIECECKGTSDCTNVHIITQNTNKDVWKLCELTMVDVVPIPPNRVNQPTSTSKKILPTG